MNHIVKYKKFDENKELFLPSYQTKGASGMDLMSIEKVGISPGQRKLVSTNLCIEIPNGMEIQIRPRSGLAAKYGITILNTPGTVDSDYRGEIKVILYNSSNDFYTVNVGDRIAQLVLAKVEYMDLTKVVGESLSETTRGEGGFGSTGLKIQ
jgi:dUTP pyrophosphatase